MTKKLTIAYSDDYLNWNLGSGDGSHPTKPIRAKIATDYLVDEVGADNVEIIEPSELEGDDHLERGAGEVWQAAGCLLEHADEFVEGFAHLAAMVGEGVDLEP